MIGYAARPFRFETMWMLDPETGFVIQDAWTKGSSFVSILKTTKVALKEWNRKSFGHLQSAIQKLKRLILGLQSSS